MRKELHFIMIEYRCSLEEIDEWDIDVLFEAHEMVPVHRRRRIADMAQAFRIAQYQKQHHFDKALRELLD